MLRKLFSKLGVSDTNSFRELVIQFFKFGLVGISNTIVSMACYYLFYYINADLYMVGSIVGTVLSIANAFFWNDKFVFSSKNNELKDKLYRLLKTYISYGGTSVLSIVLLWVEVNFFSISKSIAPIINLIITIPLNFLINKIWTFCKKTPSEKKI